MRIIENINYTAWSVGPWKDLVVGDFGRRDLERNCWSEEGVIVLSEVYNEGVDII